MGQLHSLTDTINARSNKASRGRKKHEFNGSEDINIPARLPRVFRCSVYFMPGIMVAQSPSTKNQPTYPSADGETARLKLRFIVAAQVALSVASPLVQLLQLPHVDSIHLIGATIHTVRNITQVPYGPPDTNNLIQISYGG